MSMMECPECKNEISDNSEICPKCGYRNKRSLSLLLGLGIFFIPFVFVWFVLRKGYSKTVRVISFGYLILITLSLMGNISDLNEKIEKDKAYFASHKDEIVREVKEYCDKGNYSSAIEIIDKYTFSNHHLPVFSECEDVARKAMAQAEIENKKNASKIATEKLNQEIYAPGGLDKKWPTARQCFITTMQDSTGIHTIEKQQAIDNNYIAELATTHKKISAKMLWNGKSYGGRYEKVDTLKGFSSDDDDIFNRVYVSLLGGTQINIWITKEEVLRDDFSSYSKVVHYLQRL